MYYDQDLNKCTDSDDGERGHEIRLFECCLKIINLLNWSRSCLEYTVTINQKRKFLSDSQPMISFAEIQLFSEGVQIPSSLLLFTFTSIDVDMYHASNCNDGLFTTFCQSTLDSDISPTLMITSPYPVDEIVLYNRDDCCQHRAVGATITVSTGGLVSWKSTVKTSAMLYLFTKEDDEGDYGQIPTQSLANNSVCIRNHLHCSLFISPQVYHATPGKVVYEDILKCNP